MAANIPDLEAVSNLGKQFDTPKNVFDTAEKHFNKKAKLQAKEYNKQVKQTATNRENYARSAEQAVKQGRNQFARNQQAQQKQANQAAKTHAQGVKSGRVAPAQGAPPRTFAMAPTPQAKAQAKESAAGAKTMQQQRNFAHGEALKFQAEQFKIQQKQKNYAHGQAIQENKQRNKKTAVTAPKTPSLAPSFSSASVAHTPVKAVAIPQTSFSSQLVPQKPVAKPQGSATASFSSAGTPSMSTPAAASHSLTGPQFSHAAPVKPKSVMPSFSSASATPRNLNPAFSDNPATAKPKPMGSTSTSFSH